MLSDDPYATTAPVPYLTSWLLYVPNLSVAGRLVETPDDIIRTLNNSVSLSVNGVLNPTTSLTTGYDFLYDGATAVSTALGAAATGTANKTAINDIWTKSTLIGAGALLFPSNGAAGARHRLAERARRPQPLQARRRHRRCSARPRPRAATQTFGGRLVFSMGCHAGLSVSDGIRGVGARTSIGRSSSRRKAPPPTSPTRGTATATRQLSPTPRI